MPLVVCPQPRKPLLVSLWQSYLEANRERCTSASTAPTYQLLANDPALDMNWRAAKAAPEYLHPAPASISGRRYPIGPANANAQMPSTACPKKRPTNASSQISRVVPPSAEMFLRTQVESTAGDELHNDVYMYTPQPFVSRPPNHEDGRSRTAESVHEHHHRPAPTSASGLNTGLTQPGYCIDQVDLNTQPLNTSWRQPPPQRHTYPPAQPARAHHVSSFFGHSRVRNISGGKFVTNVHHHA